MADNHSFPSADARHALSDSLAVFVPSIIQSAQAVAAKLEMFRTQTLASFEPVDKKAQAAKAEIDDILDSTMGLDTLAIPEIRITNSRAGLYIYLSAAVSATHGELLSTMWMYLLLTREYSWLGDL